VGFQDWHAKHGMVDPVRGVFIVTGFYDKHPSSSPPGTRITGVLSAPGIAAHPAEHRVDRRGRWADTTRLPALIDRADPSRFAILWNEIDAGSAQDQERQRAQAEADRLNSAVHDDNTTARLVDIAQLPDDVADRMRDTLADVLRHTTIAADQPADLYDRTAAPHLEEATATVLSVDEAPLPPAMLPPGGIVDITLGVTRTDDTRYTTTTRIGFSTPERRAVVARPGATLRVWINPDSPAAVTIDTAGLF
jgi:hypothetical protein